MKKIFIAAMLCVSACFCLVAQQVTIDNIIYSLEDDTMTAMVFGQSLTEDNTDGNIVIPETIKAEEKTYTVTSVRGSAFYKCSILKSIYLPNSLTTIGYPGAFQWCWGLTKVVLPDNNKITDIPKNTFVGCTQLADIQLPESVITIGYYAFSGCRSIKNIKFGPNLKYIAVGAFSSSGLVDVVLPAGVTLAGDWNSGVFENCVSLENIKFPADQDEVPQNVVSGCTMLKSVEIPRVCRWIKEKAFANCQSLREIVIPESVEVIYSEAFAGCENLNVIYLGAEPKTMSRGSGMELTIRSGAFKDCPNVNKIVCTSPVPPTIEEGAFDEGVLEKTIVYVPEGSEDAYKNSPILSKGKIVEGAPSGLDEIIADAEEKTAVYTVSGVKLGDSTDNLPTGIYVVRQGGVTRKVVVR